MGFPKGLTTRHPRLDIILLHLRESKITSAHHDHTIGQVQGLQDLLGVLENVFVFPGRDLWIVDAQNDLFDFLKLVNTVESPCVFAIRPRFAPVAI
jgi:hypothetical protein